MGKNETIIGGGVAGIFVANAMEERPVTGLMAGAFAGYIYHELSS